MFFLIAVSIAKRNTQTATEWTLKCTAIDSGLQLVYLASLPFILKL